MGYFFAFAVGAFVGYLLMAVMVSASKADDQSERFSALMSMPRKEREDYLEYLVRTVEQYYPSAPEEMKVDEEERE